MKEYLVPASNGIELLNHDMVVDPLTVQFILVDCWGETILSTGRERNRILLQSIRKMIENKHSIRKSYIKTVIKRKYVQKLYYN